jgi:hypothetical protein
VTFREIFIIVNYFRYINSGCIRIFMLSLAIKSDLTWRVRRTVRRSRGRRRRGMVEVRRTGGDRA